MARMSWLALPVLLLAACGPADGPVSWTVALKPLDAASSSASGRAFADVPGRELLTQLQGLPPGTYQLVLLVGDSPIRPRGARAAEGFQAEVSFREELGSLSVDASGVGSAHDHPPSGGLERAAGLLLQRLPTQGPPVPVLSGALGNLDELAPEPSAPAESSGQHHH